MEMEVRSGQHIQADPLLKAFCHPVLLLLQWVNPMEGPAVSFLIHALNAVRLLPEKQWANL